MLSLFLFYFGQFDHAIDEKSNQKGLFLIYSHYPIFIGLTMMTVSMGFLQNPELIVSLQPASLISDLASFKLLS